MRLAIVSREFPPVTEYTGGIGHQYARLAPELVRQGHEVHVITVAPERSAYHDIDGVHVHALREPRPAGPLGASRGMVGRALQVDRMLSKAGPWDVVFGAEWRGEIARYALRRDRAAVITNLASSMAKIHEASAGRLSRSIAIRTAVQRTLERRQTERSEAIVAPSRAILEWSRDRWRLDRIPTQILPNMIDVTKTRRLAHGAPPDEFPAGEPAVVFFGRLEHNKGVDLLVRAMLGLWQRGRRTRLVLIGRDTTWSGGSMALELRRLAGVHEDRLTFVGNQGPEGLFPAVAGAEVVALPSRWENFPLALLESMALGRPTVVTRVGGFPEVVEQDVNGVMVPPDDHEALGRALERLLDNPDLRASLGARAARTAEGYDIDVVTRRHAAYFEEVAH
jgi:glycogen synthase